MESVGSYQAKTHFAQLLDRVAGGGSIVIKRRGHPVAVLSPYAEVAENESLRESFAGFRKRHGIAGCKLSDQEIQSARLEGRR